MPTRQLRKGAAGLFCYLRIPPDSDQLHNTVTERAILLQIDHEPPLTFSLLCPISELPGFRHRILQDRFHLLSFFCSNGHNDGETPFHYLSYVKFIRYHSCLPVSVLDMLRIR